VNRTRSVTAMCLMSGSNINAATSKAIVPTPKRIAPSGAPEAICGFASTRLNMPEPVGWWATFASEFVGNFSLEVNGKPICAAKLAKDFASNLSPFPVTDAGQLSWAFFREASAVATERGWYIAALRYAQNRTNTHGMKGLLYPNT
jgi:hypothetical protein